MAWELRFESLELRMELYRRLSIYFDRFGYESQFRDSDHDHIVLHGRSDLVETEILREDDRSRECSIKTLFHEHTTSIEIYR
jgi:hypothetical protein